MRDAREEEEHQKRIEERSQGRTWSISSSQGHNLRQEFVEVGLGSRIQARLVCPPFYFREFDQGSLARLESPRFVGVFIRLVFLFSFFPDTCLQCPFLRWPFYTFMCYQLCSLTQVQVSNTICVQVTELAFLKLWDTGTSA